MGSYNTMRKTSIHDIARNANVSAMTVTRAFNGSAPVAPATHKKIMEEAKRLNYYPNALVKGVKGQRTKTVGLIFNAATPETTADNINLIVGELQRNGYTPYIMSVVPRESELKTILKNYICQRVDGVIIWSDYPPLPYSRDIAELLENFNASAFISSDRLKYSSDQVVRSPFNAIRDIVDHFVACGRRKPSIFTSLPVNKSKVDAFVSRLKFHGLKIDANTHIAPVFDMAKDKSYHDIEYQNSLEKRFVKSFPFDALLCACDEGAASSMEYLKKCNVKIPEDIAVVGYNNYGLSKFLSPPLASVELNFNQAALSSVEMLINRLNDKELPQQIKELPLSFVWRESAGGSKCEG